MNARLVRRGIVAARTLAFEVDQGEPFDFKAGQSCEVVIPHPLYTDDLGNARTFSVASAPGVAPLLFATRLTESAFKRSLAEVEPGATIDLDGPYGSFTLHHNAARPAVLLAGGIGITPFRSMIADATRRCLPHRITLLYANRNATSAPFLEDLQQWARQNPQFHLVATLTAPVANEPWPFETGRIDEAFVQTHVPDARDAVFYIAGPGRFVRAMTAILDAVGADPDSVKSEEFPGY